MARKPRPSRARGTKAPTAAKARPRRAARAKAAPGVKVDLYQVDAFTGRLFHGNPACVALPQGPISTEAMRSLAAETNQPVTTFLTPAGAGKWKVRWFTPVTELPLCGHGTLAAAHVLFGHTRHRGSALSFASASGVLKVQRQGDLLMLDFPANPGAECEPPAALVAGLGVRPALVLKAAGYVAVFENKRDVHELRPNFEALKTLGMGVAVTAPGAGHDFVSRNFIPHHGINEDHVSGAPHCTLIPYWAAVLGKTHLTAHQVSARGGELCCELRGKRVGIGGRAATFSACTVRVPE